MANFDWNEIIVTNDGNVANEQVKERIILVTGEKGDNGKDGRGILRVRKTGVSGRYVTFAIEYDDGTRSNFTLELPSGQGGDMDTTIIAEEFDSANRYYEGYYVTYNGILYQFLQDHLVGEWNPDHVRPLFVMTDVYRKANSESIAEEYVLNKAYHVGDFVMHNGDLYEFVAEHQRSAPWNLDEVRLCTVLDLIPDEDKIAPQFDASYSYANGDYVMYNGELYKCIWGHQGAWNPDDFEKVSIIELIKDSAINIVARKFRDNIDYDVDSYVIDDGRLCRFTVPYQHGESFIDKIAFVRSTDEMKRLFESAESKIAPMFDENTNYAVGDLVRERSDVYPHNVRLYEFIQNHPAGEWDGRQVIGTTIERLLKKCLSSNIIASDFNTHTNYEVGEYVMYDRKLYCFTADHTAGAWIGTDAIQIILADYFVDNRRFNEWIADKANSTSLAPEFSENDTYAVGDYVMRNGILYKTSTAHTGVWNNNDFYTVEVTDEFLDQSDLNLYLADKANLSVVAPDFNANSTYNIGERVIYDGVLYQFIAQHTGAWNSSDVTRTSLDNILNTDENKIKQKASYFAVASAFNTLFHYSAGDYVYYGDYLYKFTADHQGEWDSSDVETATIADDFATKTKLNTELAKKASLTDLATKTSLFNVADDFSTSTAYTAGDCVIYNGNLYRFTTDHTAGAWNANQVEQVNLITVIDENGKAIWGEISGNITDQTDLMELLAVTIDKTVYVSASTGADTNDGTQEHPFATLAKAVEAIPESGKGTIYIGTGTYNEDLSITGKTVEIQKYNVVSPYAIKINGMSILNSDVTFDGSISLDLLQQAVIENSTFTAGSNAYFASGTSETAIKERFVVKNSKFVFKGKITTYGINDNHMFPVDFPNYSRPGDWGYTSIHAYNSYVYINNLETNARLPVLIQDGSIFCYRTYTSTYDVNITVPITNKYFSASGGRIYTDIGIDFDEMASQKDVASVSTGIYGRTNGNWIWIGNYYYDKTQTDGFLADKVSSDDLETELAKKEDIIINDATGSPATLESEMAVNLTKCIADIDFTQDTDGYEPSMKNLIQPFTDQTLTDGTLTVDEDGNCTVNKPEKSTTVYFTHPTPITLQPRETYRLSLNNPVGKNYLQMYLSRYADPEALGSPLGDVLSSSANASAIFHVPQSTITTPVTAYLHISVRSNIFTNFKFSPMLEVLRPVTQNIMPHFDSETVNENSLSVDTNGKCTVSSPSGNTSVFTVKTMPLEVGRYKLSLNNSVSSTSIRIYIQREVDGETLTLKYLSTGNTNAMDEFRVTEADTYNVHISCNEYASNVLNNYEFTPIIQRLEEPASSYSPYNHICPIVGRTGLTLTANGTNHAISWQSQAGTVYKGSLDVLTGTLTVTYGEIASYNGQTLTGMWYSDRDVYAEGITPTTGAQVIYQLATPLTYQLTPTEIQTIVGSNSFSADSGEVFVQYFTDQKLQSYIDEHDEELRSETKTALTDKADVITSSASGNPVTIADGSPSPVVDLTVEVEPIQNLHGVDYPYPAGGGKNIYPPVVAGTYTDGGITVVVDSNNLITVSGTKNTNGAVTITMPYMYSGRNMPSGTYLHIRNSYADENIRMYVGTATVGYVTLLSVNRIFYVSTGGDLETFSLYFSSNIASGTELNFTLQPSVEMVDTTTDYEPYENICPISGWAGCNVVRSRVFTPNQFINNGNFTSTTNWSGLKSTISVENNILKIQGDGQNATNGCYQKLNTIDPIGHIFFVTCDAKADVANIDCNIGLNYGANSNNLVFSNNQTLTTSWQTLCGIREFGEHSTYGFGFRFMGVNPNRIPDNSYAYVRNVMIIDLTEMFGEQVAEQILAMEQTESGSGIAVVKGFFPEEYYPTNNDTSPENDGQGSLYSITFPTEAGTVYGGSLNGKTGVMTIDKASVILDGTESWTYNNRTDIDNFAYAYSSVLDSVCNNQGNFYCDKLCPVYGKITQSYATDKSICNISNADTSSLLRIKILKSLLPEESKDGFSSWLSTNHVNLVYTLATPVTYQLTPVEVTTLLGENTISADTGAVDVTYRADTKTYIDQKIAESQRATRSLIAGIETEMVATKNYNVGDLLIVGDTLYKVTANIAIAGAITVGTNVTATTVAEQLILLANA